MKRSLVLKMISMFMAVVMFSVSLPLNVLANTYESSYTPIDYTPFLIETVDGKAAYNAQTANRLFKFYNDSKSLVKDESDGSQPINEFVFSYNDVD